MRYTAVVGIMDDLSLGHGNPNGFGAISDWTIHANREGQSAKNPTKFIPRCVFFLTALGESRGKITQTLKKTPKWGVGMVSRIQALNLLRCGIN